MNFPKNASKQHKGLVYQYVGGSLFGEKLFLLIFIPFYWFDQKKLFKQIQIFLRICPISNMVRKTNFLSISVLVFWDSHFFDKKIVLNEFPQKCFKTTERHSLAVCDSICGENSFCLYLFHFTGLFQKNCLKKFKFFSGFAPFKYGKKNKLSEYFSAHFWDSHFYV